MSAGPTPHGDPSRPDDAQRCDPGPNGDSEASPSVPAVTLWGRDGEVELMDGFAARACETAGGVVIIGEPGIGKSSLWTRGVAALRRAGAGVIATTCVEAESEMPYAGLDELIGGLLDEYGATLPALQQAALEGALLRGSTEMAIDGRTVAVGVLTLLRRALVRGPVVLAVDDLHWIDVETEQCLVYAIRRLGDRRLTLLLSTRGRSPLWQPSRPTPDPAALACAVDGVRALCLTPLPPRAIGQMLRDRLGLVLSIEESTRIAEQTGGNPFWALQFGRSRSDVVGAPDALSLGELIPKRIADLPAPALDAACLVAALGRPRIATVVRAVSSSGDGASDPESVLDAAIGSGLLVVVGDRLAASHPLLGTALVASLPPFRRRRLQQRAADLADSAEARAVHLLRADTEIRAEDDPSSAGRARRAELRGALDAAAVSAQRRGAPSTAARFGGQALELAERDASAPGCGPGVDEQDLDGRRVAIAELHYRAAELDAVLQVLDRVDLAALDEDLLERAGPLLAQTVNERQGATAARAAVEDIAALPRSGFSSDGMRRRQALVATLRADLHSGALGDRRATARSAVENAETSPVLLPLRRRALGVLASALLDVGEPIGEVLDRLVRLDHPDGNEIGSGVGAGVLEGLRLLATGDLEHALPVLDGVLSHHLMSGDAQGATTGAALLAYGEVVAGRLNAAEETLRRLGDHVDDRAMEWPHMVFVRGMIHLARGEHDALDELLSRTSDGVDGAACGLDFVLLLTGLFHLRCDDPARAVTGLGRFVDDAERRGVLDPQRRFGADVDLAEAMMMVGDHAGVERVTERLGAFVRRTGCVITQGQRLRVMAQLALRRDHDLARAAALARGATQLHRPGSSPVEYGRSLAVLADVEQRCGDPDSATEHRRRAHALFAAAGHLWWAERTAERPPGASLSPGERPVAALVAEGASNREAAAALHLSVRTVENHLAHVYRKLGIRSRGELAQQLLDP